MILSSNDSGYAEKRLLVACARTSVPAATIERMRGLAARPLDWEFVISAAAENSIMPLVARQLSAHAAGLVPAPILERIAGAARANTLRCLALTGELLHVLGEFQREGIEAIPYKGPVLAAQAYGDVALREYEDLDIVLRHRDAAKAHEVMQALGYEARYPWIHSSKAASLVPGEYNYREKTRGIIVELHTEQTMRHFPVQANLDALSRRLITVGVSGHEVRTFCVEDLLPILCVHGAKDYWERIVWVADIAELAQRPAGLDWDTMLRRAEELKAERMLRVGLALATELLEAPLPPGVAARVAADGIACAVAKGLAVRLLERESRRMEGAAIFRFRRNMVAGRAMGWRYAWRLALAPAETDWQAMQLPRGLAPLYVPLRPLFLLRKYGWGERGEQGKKA